MKPKCRLYACVQFRGEWVCDSASKKDKKILCVEKETECNVCQTLIPTPQIPRALISHENGCPWYFLFTLKLCIQTVEHV